MHIHVCVCVCVYRGGGEALGAGGVGVDEGLHGCGLLFASLLWWMGI